jgi:hypothetical protein
VQGPRVRSDLPLNTEAIRPAGAGSASIASQGGSAAPSVPLKTNVSPSGAKPFRGRKSWQGALCGVTTRREMIGSPLRRTARLMWFMTARSIDDPFPDLGTSCTVGVGACVATSVRVCGGEGTTTVCGATPGTPTPER